MTDVPLCVACGTPLPDGAMFCGECGRAVAPAVPTAQPDPEVCAQCGTALAAGDIFCPECGHVGASVARGFAGASVPRQRDTVAVDPVELAMPDPSETGIVTASRLPARGRPVFPSSVGRAEPVGRAGPVGRAEPVEQSDADDVEATRIVRARGGGDRFVLQFSTGESVTTTGSGLVGRNPLPEPGEYFEQLVRIVDPTRSVSKTHLEFGQEDGTFWLSDRYSGNGTIVREPDARPMRCEPGKRYRIARGTRVDIGEQFFVVS